MKVIKSLVIKDFENETAKCLAVSFFIYNFAAMKRVMLLIMAAGLVLTGWAQTEKKEGPFRAYIYNKEYEVYMRLNLYEQDVTIPGQELYGQLPGYLGKLHNSFCWVITSCRLLSDKKAELQLINDFGSEDLTATLVQTSDSTYTLRQGAGSTIKVPLKGKWQKLPKTLNFKKEGKR